jgi:hypothetical protein
MRDGLVSVVKPAQRARKERVGREGASFWVCKYQSVQDPVSLQ